MNTLPFHKTEVPPKSELMSSGTHLKHWSYKMDKAVKGKKDNQKGSGTLMIMLYKQNTKMWDTCIVGWPGMRLFKF